MMWHNTVNYEHVCIFHQLIAVKYSFNVEFWLFTVWKFLLVCWMVISYV